MNEKQDLNIEMKGFIHKETSKDDNEWLNTYLQSAFSANMKRGITHKS